MKCKCAREFYRNTAQGQERKFLGKIECMLCRGSGKVKPCENCEGCGMKLGDLCTICLGKGKVKL